MQYVGKVLSSVSGFYKDLNPATLTGAIDVVVIKDSSGELRCSPWHVRFGKLQLLRPSDKVVEIVVNDKPASFYMKVDDTGEAFFVLETENPVPRDIATSPIPSPVSSPAMSVKGDDEEPDFLDLNGRAKAQGEGKHAENYYSAPSDSELEDEAMSGGALGGHDGPDSWLEGGGDQLGSLGDSSSLKSKGRGGRGGHRSARRMTSVDSLLLSSSPDATDQRSEWLSARNRAGASHTPKGLRHVQSSNNVLDLLESDTASFRAQTPEDAGRSAAAEEGKNEGSGRWDYEYPSKLKRPRSVVSDTEFIYTSRSEGSMFGNDVEDGSDVHLEWDWGASVPRQDEARRVFDEHLVVQNAFSEDPLSKLDSPDAVFRYQDSYYSWRDLAPALVGFLLYKDQGAAPPLQPLADYTRISTEKPPADTRIVVEEDAARPESNCIVSGSGSAPSGSQPEKLVDNTSRASPWRWWGKSTKSTAGVNGVAPHQKQQQQQQIPQSPPSPPLLLPPATPEAKTRLTRDEGSPHTTTTASLRPKQYAKTLRLTSEQLSSLDLKYGMNKVVFRVKSNKASSEARIFMYDNSAQIVVSDIDGTITKSDVMGHLFNMVGKDWTHIGVAKLYTDIRNNGYEIFYLTARAIGQAHSTREFLRNVKQDGYMLPEGPLLLSPDRLFTSFHREVILRRPQEFKMTCLRQIRNLFGENNPFYAGFGNRITDAMSYRSVNIPVSRICTIDSTGKVKLELLPGYNSSYVEMNDLVDFMFPQLSSKIDPKYNDWEYWKVPISTTEIDFDEVIRQEEAEKAAKGAQKDNKDAPSVMQPKAGSSDPAAPNGSMALRSRPGALAPHHPSAATISAATANLATHSGQAAVAAVVPPGKGYHETVPIPVLQGSEMVALPLGGALTQLQQEGSGSSGPPWQVKESEVTVSPTSGQTRASRDMRGEGDGGLVYGQTPAAHSGLVDGIDQPTWLEQQGPGAAAVAATTAASSTLTAAPESTMYMSPMEQVRLAAMHKYAAQVTAEHAATAAARHQIEALAAQRAIGRSDPYQDAANAGAQVFGSLAESDKACHGSISSGDYLGEDDDEYLNESDISDALSSMSQEIDLNDYPYL
ncbi:lipin Ned1 [Spiromyces aspiralis]|uniref:Lipin Ned1 n=1 Tax=Spiromyces aspiralis TaxID=68401 RepID=A0ACC1HXA6_9FUNG|nr:lipin Ned1 [Spiromyces aspiralis]